MKIFLLQNRQNINQFQIVHDFFITKICISLKNAQKLWIFFPNKTNIVVYLAKRKDKTKSNYCRNKKGPNLYFGSLRELLQCSVFSQYLRDKVEKTQFLSVQYKCLDVSAVVFLSMNVHSKPKYEKSAIQGNLTVSLKG